MIIKNAKQIESKAKKQCAFCFLLDSDDSNAKFHLYELGYGNLDDDKYICEYCLASLKDIRKKCHIKCDNNATDPFKDFKMWYIKDQEKFKK